MLLTKYASYSWTCLTFPKHFLDCIEKYAQFFKKIHRSLALFTKRRFSYGHKRKQEQVVVAQQNTRALKQHRRLTVTGT
mgnify:CR=1 FL=1